MFNYSQEEILEKIESGINSLNSSTKSDDQSRLLLRSLFDLKKTIGSGNSDKSELKKLEQILKAVKASDTKVNVNSPVTVNNTVVPVNSKGKYQSGVSYAPGDLVSYKGSSYISTGGNSAPGGDSWTLLSEQGSDGEKGVRGRRGQKGASGEQGAQGIQGVSGKDGIIGSDGIDGKDGKDGKDGIDGKKGNKGDRGLRGFKGDEGEPGPRGVQGIRGMTGSSGSGDGIEEAPEDGTPYSRQDANWVSSPSGGSTVWGDITGTLSDQIDLQAELDTKIEADSTDTLTNKTLDDYTNHIHADALHFRVKATEDIDKGQPVTITGWNVGESAYEVELANQQNNVANGLASTNMLNGEFGMMEQSGTLVDIDTSAWSEGLILYLDGTGILTDIEPTTGYSQPIAYVVRSHAINGALQVNADYPKQDAYDVRYNTINNVGDELDKINAIHTDTGEPNGFIREEPTTMGDISFVDATRTFSITPQSGETTFDYYVEGVKTQETATKSLVISDVNGLHIIYFDETGELQESTSLSTDILLKYAIVTILYWNVTVGANVVFADERHGVQMDGFTHLYNHRTFGARYFSGLAINGVTEGLTTYTGSEAGVIFDEDITNNIDAQTDAEYWYMDGSYWAKDTATNVLAKMGTTYANYNEFNGTTWQQTELGMLQFVCVHFLATNNISSKVVMVQGQDVYTRISNAREGANDEIASLILAGMPTPEFVFVATVILDRNGEVVTNDLGSTWLDWRTSGIASATAPSSHINLSDKAVDGHPADVIIPDTTNFTNNLSSLDDTVQKALDTVDDLILGTVNETDAYLLARVNHTGTQTASTISDFDTEVSNNTDVVANTAKITYPSADSTKLAGIEALAEVNNISDVNATDLTDGGDTTLHDHDGISENTSARHAQGTDTTLGSGAVAQDHGTGTTDQIVNVCYGTSATPPTASTTTEGSLYIQYIA
ncbi:MAG: hypothetical protein U9P50_00500 [Patescibacteria group bacterium]|nr:hypothetical protein [Patescibacteria group bacterium]